jgi:hypothetical protein
LHPRFEISDGGWKSHLGGTSTLFAVINSPQYHKSQTSVHPKYDDSLVQSARYDNPGFPRVYVLVEENQWQLTTHSAGTAALLTLLLTSSAAVAGTNEHSKHNISCSAATHT